MSSRIGKIFKLLILYYDSLNLSNKKKETEHMGHTQSTSKEECAYGCEGRKVIPASMVAFTNMVIICLVLFLEVPLYMQSPSRALVHL